MLGAKVILTPAAERGSGMVRKAAELAQKHGWFLARQFENEANPAYHRSTTGPEIVQDFVGRRLDYFVTRHTSTRPKMPTWPATSARGPRSLSSGACCTAARCSS